MSEMDRYEITRTVQDLDRGNFRGAEDHLRRELYNNPNAINIVNNIELQPGHARMHVDMFQNGQMRFTQLPGYPQEAYPPVVEQVPVQPRIRLNIDLGNVLRGHHW